MSQGAKDLRMGTTAGGIEIHRREPTQLGRNPEVEPLAEKPLRRTGDPLASVRAKGSAGTWR
jgi:hypothetical protein